MEQPHKEHLSRKCGRHLEGKGGSAEITSNRDSF